MKLLNYTSSIFSGILFLLLSIWAILFYFEMLDEIYDSLDDGLENHKLLVIQRAHEDPSFLNRPEFEDGFTIQEIKQNNILAFTDSYRDTLMYMQNEKDYEPVRLLESVFEQDGKYYLVKIVTSMVEEDDLVKELFFGLLWLYFGLILSVILLNNLLHRRIWKPFYKLLSRLDSFRIDKDTEIETEPTNIDEFKLLNTQVKILLRKSVDRYHVQKEFIENASHELQTPLAISINKLELLVEKDQLTEDQTEKVAEVIENLERLTRFNRSLLLLSKIENRQFPEMEMVNFNDLVKEVVADFEDLASYRSLRIEVKGKYILQHQMNKDLARILVTNLIKNALIHGKEGGIVMLEFFQNSLEISNEGVNLALDSENLMSRFQNSSAGKSSTGLGLAISKVIVERFGLKLSYNFSGRHTFRLDF